jgi:hypothetical protein
VEFCRVVVWPTAALGVAFLYRERLGQLLERTKSVSVAGAKADFAETQSGGEKADIDEPIVSKHADPLASPVQDQLLKSFEKELENYDDAYARSFLLKAFTRERIEKFFSLAFANMFASQVDALELLAKSDGRVRREIAEKEFQKLKDRDPFFRNWTLERFLSYLRNYDLVEVSEHDISISPAGIEFLKFLTTYQLSRSRPIHA